MQILHVSMATLSFEVPADNRALLKLHQSALLCDDDWRKSAATKSSRANVREISRAGNHGRASPSNHHRLLS